MAWHRKLPSGRFNGMYRDADGKRKSAGTFDTEDEAITAAELAEKHARGGGQSTNPTWAEWSTVWMQRRKVEESTRRRDQGRVDTHLIPKWGGMRLSEITRVQAQGWVDDDLSHLSPSTVRKCVAALGSSLKAAANAGYRCEAAARGLDLPALTPSPERWLSDDEVAAVRDVLDERYRLTFDLLLGTGMRWGEAVALHWDHVDLDGKAITVRWGWDGEVMKSPKSKQKRRIPIGDTLVSVLRKLLEDRGLGEAPRVEYVGGNRPMYGLILAGSKKGRPITSTSFSHALGASGRAASVGEGADRRRVGHVRPHDLRHTYASSLLQKGVPLETVSALLGHSSVLVTQRYADAGESRWDDVRAVLG
ncbi:putative integrase [Gordonia sihwensis NBRC 108236]|uniref:Putative integrase n=2 Tax=Gordoniaceae TaxID=85026 RepID=L7LN12_9ACTN|nr:integrase [Gordonia sp. YC-JH1]GAC62126.1 putative integrase [Gordonia sihwensis NBRC 108236]